MSPSRSARWSFDDQGRVKSRTLPEGQRESFTYDLNGDPLTHTDFNGKTTHYVYDTHHRETTRSYADGSRVVTTYTATGQIDTVTDGSGLTDYDYDAADRLTKVSYPTGQLIEYGYDATGNKVTLRSGSHTVTYTYTALNQLETVTDESGTTTYSYDEVGHQTRVAYPNGATTETVVDGVGHTKQVTSRDIHGTVIAETLYTLDPAGHRKTLTELNRTVDYAYDELYRLTGETITDDTGGRSPHGTSTAPSLP